MKLNISSLGYVPSGHCILNIVLYSKINIRISTTAGDACEVEAAHALPIPGAIREGGTLGSSERDHLLTISLDTHESVQAGSPAVPAGDCTRIAES